MPGGQSAVYEFTLFKEQRDGERVFELGDVHTLLRSGSKAYTFQLEQCPESGKLHYQGRLSLFKKTTLGCASRIFPDSGIHLSPTATENTKGPPFYVLKVQTRVEGPWTEKDYEEPRVPSTRLRDYGILEQRLMWQQDLHDILVKEEHRIVNMIIDRKGNNGKSAFVEWMEYKGLTIEMPEFMCAEDLLATAMDLPEQKIYLFDFSRATPQKHMAGLFSAIEKLKNGLMYDKRYHFKRRRLSYSPSICVFSNTEPDLRYLSRDRWRLFSITDDRQLGPYNGRQEEEVDESGVDETSSYRGF